MADTLRDAETACDSAVRRQWARSDKPAPASCARVFGREFLLWDEERLLWLVLLGGALGALLHSLRSFGWYVGNREMRMSWIPYYFMLPFTGAVLGLVFYAAIRGGFMAPGTGVEQTSPFAFFAITMLVGMFSQEASVKLKQIAETIFTKPSPGADARPQSALQPVAPSPPVIQSVSRTGGAGTFTITGTGFAPTCEVFANGEKREVTRTGATTLSFTLSPAPDPGTPVRVEVRNPDGQEAAGATTA